MVSIAAMLVPLSTGGFGRYWLQRDGKPKEVASPIYAAGQQLRHRYASGSVVWASLPKSFTIHPSACRERDERATRAFTARYAYGWAQKQRHGANEAIRRFDPSYYYSNVTNRESAAGRGSDLGTNFTLHDIEFISWVVRTFNVTTMIDVPCGDANWQFGSYELDTLDAYVGLDIVPHLIELNTVRFAHHSNKRFATWDMATCALPRIRRLNGASSSVSSAHDFSRNAADSERHQGPPDLILSRHVLQHMTLARARAAAGHLVGSGARLQLISAVEYNTTRGRPWACSGTSCQEGGHMLPDTRFLGYPPPIACGENTHTYQRLCLYKFDEDTRVRWLELATRRRWIGRRRGARSSVL